MTIKQWFYRHPNVTTVLLGLWYLFLVACTVSHLHNERWGWFAVGVVASISAGTSFINWWRRHQ